VFYYTFVEFIQSLTYTQVLEFVDTKFKLFLGFNSTHIQLIGCFLIILAAYVSELINVYSKKLWFYTTLFTFLVTVVNLNYLCPLQLAGSDYVNNFYNSLVIENVSDSIKESTEQSMLFGIYCQKKIGLLFCVLVSYIFILCAYLKQVVCTKQEILLYVALEYFLIKAFSTTNLLEFYMYYEAVLIPMYLLIVG
jgi:NADH:ubiquinone oxidoreductase subunit 4 (subunit M)